MPIGEEADTSSFSVEEYVLCTAVKEEVCFININNDERCPKDNRHNAKRKEL